MEYQTINPDTSVMANTLRGFILGIASTLFVLFMLTVSANHQAETGIGTVNCDDPAQRVMSQDRSRNGISTVCE